MVSVRIRAVALDVDGVLTDGSFWWGPNGEEFKRFHFLDVMGVARAARSGVLITLISGEEGPIIDRYAAKLRIDDVFSGCKDKAAALREFAARRALDMASICFMGDDINDLPAMSLAGFSAAPSTAHPVVLAKASYVTVRPGGNGAVRELLDHLVSTGALSPSPDLPTLAS
jgi:3-deoxy-D-manno-octulosonate 8-phosphate phosphatase (KDO 8-P phosphatase)